MLNYGHGHCNMWDINGQSMELETAWVKLRLTFWGVLVFDYTPVHNCHCDLNPPFKYKKEKNNFSWTSISCVFFFISLFFFSNQMTESNLGFGLVPMCKFFFRRCQIRHSYLSQIPTPFLCPCNAAKIYNTTLLTLCCLLFRPFIGYMV